MGCLLAVVSRAWLVIGMHSSCCLYLITCESFTLWQNLCVNHECLVFKWVIHLLRHLTFS